MSYQPYRLQCPMDNLSLFLVHIKNLKLLIEEHTFDSVDSIRVLEYLTRFVNDAGRLNMSEVQSFLEFPMFLTDLQKWNFGPPLHAVPVVGLL